MGGAADGPYAERLRALGAEVVIVAMDDDPCRLSVVCRASHAAAWAWAWTRLSCETNGVDPAVFCAAWPG